MYSKLLIIEGKYPASTDRVNELFVKFTLYLDRSINLSTSVWILYQLVPFTECSKRACAFDYSFPVPAIPGR